MKWSSQYVTWCQFNAIKHFKWNWSCPFQLWLFGDNQFCNCFPLCIPSKIRASSRCVSGLVWLFPERAGKAKLFVLFLDQSRCESDYSPTADRLSGRTRELASLGSGSSSRRVHVSFTITFLTAVGKQPRQWFSLHLLFLGETQSEGDVRECIQVSEALPCTKVFTVQATGTPPRCPPQGRSYHPHWGWILASGGVTVLGSTVIPSACVDLHPESDHLCTFCESLGYLTAVAETPNSSPSTCHLVRRGSSGAKSQGSCLGYLWHGAREDWAGDTGEYLLKSHKTFLVNQNSGNYSACWPGLGIYRDLGHPLK